MIVARRAIFLEEEYLLQEDSGSKVILEEVPDPQVNTASESEVLVRDPIVTHINEPRKSGRVTKLPARYVGHIDGGDSKVPYHECNIAHFSDPRGSCV